MERGRVLPGMKKREQEREGEGATLILNVHGVGEKETGRGEDKAE